MPYPNKYAMTAYKTCTTRGKVGGVNEECEVLRQISNIISNCKIIMETFEILRCQHFNKTQLEVVVKIIER